MKLHNVFFFFFNDTATTEIYTLSLHDALPIYVQQGEGEDDMNDDGSHKCVPQQATNRLLRYALDRKSTRLNSSHANISYAVFCLKKKKQKKSLLHLISHT